MPDYDWLVRWDRQMAAIEPDAFAAMRDSLNGADPVTITQAVDAYMATHGVPVSSASLSDATTLGKALITAASSADARQSLGVTQTVDVRNYGATGDGVTDDTAAITAALAAASPGVVYFPPGTYRLVGAIPVASANVTLLGAGASATTIRLTDGFRPKQGGFTVRGINFVAASYNTAYRAIQFDNFTGDGLSGDVSGFTVQDCRFDGFFYATNFMGATYAAASNPAFTPNGFVRDVTIENCVSVAPAAVNAGHFQHIMCADVSVSGCSTYGGAGATSFNFIGGNGYLRLTGNFCNGNSYGSCEIENQSGDTSVTGNTFRSKLWLDDSSNIAVAGNVLEGGVSITVQTFDVRNITIAGNVVASVRVEKFSDPQTMTVVVDGVVVSGNTINGASTWGVFVSDSSARIRGVDIIGNTFTGTFTSGAIGVVRNEGMVLRMLWNHLRASNNSITVSSTGGIVQKLGNTGEGLFTGVRDKIEFNYRDFSVKEGVVVASPGGTLYRITVDNAGVLGTSTVVT